MARWDTGQDILIDVLFRCSESIELAGAGVSDYLDAAKRYVAMAYWDVYSWAPWPWALKYPPGVFQTVAKVTGDMTLVQGDATVTLGAAIAASMAGRKLRNDSTGITYRILTHAAGSASLVLDVPYAEESGTASFSIYQDEYQLVTGANGAIKPWRFRFRNRPAWLLRFCSKEEIDEKIPYSTTSVIRRIAMITENRVQIHPWPESIFTIEYDYAERQSPFTFDAVAATDTPAVPVDDRHVISYLAQAMLWADKNRSDKESESLTLGIGKLNRMQDKYLPQLKKHMMVRGSNAIGRGA